MSNTSEKPGSENCRSFSINQPHIQWEISFISLLLLAIQARAARILWFEQEDRRKALEIDRLYKEVELLRRDRSERQRAA